MDFDKSSIKPLVWVRIYLSKLSITVRLPLTMISLLFTSWVLFNFYYLA